MLAGRQRIEGVNIVFPQVLGEARRTAPQPGAIQPDLVAGIGEDRHLRIAERLRQCDRVAEENHLVAGGRVVVRPDRRSPVEIVLVNQEGQENGGGDGLWVEALLVTLDV